MEAESMDNLHPDTTANRIALMGRRIRDAVNGCDRDLAETLAEPGWRQICAAMDLWGDASEALKAAEHVLFPVNHAPVQAGYCYLAIYGLLQSFVLQQDAMRLLVSSLAQNGIQIDPDGPDRVQEIYRRLRDLRIRVTGHPIDERSVSREGAAVQWGLSRMTVDSPRAVRLYHWNGWFDDKDLDKGEVLDFAALLEDHAIWAEANTSAIERALG